MADYLVTDTELTSIANAIRTKGDTNGTLSFPSGFISAINNISSTPAVSTGSVLVLDDLDIINGLYIDTDGSEVSYGTWSATNYTEVTGNKLVFYSYENSGGNYSAFYSSNYTFISSFSYYEGINEINVPNNATYFRISFATEYNQGLTVYKQVQQTFQETTNKLSPKDVNFYDYDGTIVYAYTAAEFAQLTALPPNPVHTGLISQGWNWKLSKAKEFVAAYGKIDIGEMYITDDDATRLDIYINNSAIAETPLYFTQTVSQGVTIDWGDNTSTTTVSGTGAVNTSHTYAAPGYYTISMSCTSGIMNFGDGNITTGTYHKIGIFGSIAANNLYNYAKLQHLFLGKIEDIANESFAVCRNLKTVTLPFGLINIRCAAFAGAGNLLHITIPITLRNLYYYSFGYYGGFEDSFYIEEGGPKTISFSEKYTWFGMYAFLRCYQLERVILPYTCPEHEYYEGGAFQACYSLTEIIIPEGAYSLSWNIFSYVLSLTSITIPASVSHIGEVVFYRNYALKEIHMKGTEPPTIEDNAITIPQTCTIYVPKSTGHTVLNAYKAATNWSTLASQIQEEP